MGMLGMYGPVVFQSGSGSIIAFDDMRKTVTARWETHEIFKSKPLLEFAGPSLIEIEFSMNFIKPITADPLGTIIILQETMDLALPWPLVIGLFPMGRGSSLFIMTELEVNPKYFYRGGGFLGASVKVKLKEYSESSLVSNFIASLGGLIGGGGIAPDVAAQGLTKDQIVTEQYGVPDQATAGEF